MSEKKQSRQTTLFSFFRQPSKANKAQSSEKKSKKTPVKRDEKQVQPKSDATSNGAASPTTIDVRERPVVSPIESNTGNATSRRGTTTRKRPRSKPSTVEKDESSESLMTEQSRVELSDDSHSTADNSVKQSKNDDQQKQEEASAVTTPIPNQNEDDRSSDDDSENEAEQTNEEEEGMSAYELLRQRNIERNNARLASLGLLNPVPLESEQPKKKKSRRAKKTPTAAKPPSIPTRRSTRSRRSVLDATETTSIGIDNATEESQDLNGEPVAQEEEETYTVSPLVQYAMAESTSSSNETIHGSSRGDDFTSVSDCANSSLYPMGPRLVPPKGLKAIYSLDFSEPFHSHPRTWLVGAGKSGIVALWDCNDWSSNAAHGSEEEIEEGIDPALTWKAHNGRWIAEARFLPSSTSSSSSSLSSQNHNHHHHPSRLVTAANDGKLCLWDLSTVSVRTGAPKLLSQSGADLHTSGIFAMDIVKKSTWSSRNEICIATGSKDKTVALSVLHESSSEFRPIWKSNVHAAKVGAVRLHPTRNSILASASDDDVVCVHDYKCGEMNGLVVELENAHHRPHSVVWDPYHPSDLLMTAGLDKDIKIWDIRSTKEPVVSLYGHVPENIPRCKRIHHPAFYYPQRKRDGGSFVLSGGERSQALSMFHYNEPAKQERKEEKSTTRLYSRGKLPVDCGDAGCIAVNDDKVAVSVQDGEVLILGPIHNEKQ